MNVCYITHKRYCDQRNFMVNKESHRARKKFRNFEDARKFAREIGLKSAREWSDFARSGTMPIDIPERPEQFYTKSWDGWADWLGNDESKAWEIMEKLRKTTGDFSNYK